MSKAWAITHLGGSESQVCRWVVLKTQGGQGAPGITLTKKLKAASSQSLVSRSRLSSKSNEVGVMASSPLCVRCSAVPFDSLPFEDEDGYPFWTWREILYSQGTCVLCQAIIHAACRLKDEIMEQSKENTPYIWNGQYISGPVPEISHSMRVWLFGNKWRLDQSKPPNQLIGLGVRLGMDSKPENAEGTMKGSSGSTVHLRGTFLRVCCTLQDPMARLVPGRNRAIDSSSDLAFERLQRWLGNCDQMHDCVHQAPILPSRVLDLGGPGYVGSVKLLDTKGSVRSARYIALSHCWGSTHTITTTVSTLSSRRLGIPDENLPKTYLDAIWICRRLNVQYLWIDSLCIIQDDKKDWANEASKMADVYEQAYLTIAAADSKDDLTGCFPSRTQLMYKPIDCQIFNETRRNHSIQVVVPVNPRFTQGRRSSLLIHPEWMQSSPKAEPLIYRVGSYGGCNIDPLEEEKLSSRSWTLQERMISRRTIHYGNEQMFWECRAKYVCEDGARFPRAWLNLESLLRDCNKEWKSLVTSYSERRITRETDRFAALSGIVSRIAGATNDVYYAGLWKSSIWDQLFWCTSSSDTVWQPIRDSPNSSGNYLGNWARAHGPEILANGEKNRGPDGKAKMIYMTKQGPYAMFRGPRLSGNPGWINTVSKTRQYVAPSWSWASVTGRVTFPFIAESQTEGDFRITQPTAPPDDYIAEFLGCYISLAGEDPYGEITEGWIRLKAPLLPLAIPNYDLVASTDPNMGTRVIAYQGIATQGNGTIGTGRFDFPPGNLHQVPLFALFITPAKALILRLPGRGECEYRRVGIVYFPYGTKVVSAKDNVTTVSIM